MEARTIKTYQPKFSEDDVTWLLNCMALSGYAQVPKSQLVVKKLQAAGADIRKVDDEYFLFLSKEDEAKKEEAQNAQYKNIELGNLLFGHSRGNFALPRDKYGDSFNSFLVQGGFDSYGRPNDCGVSANWMDDCGDGRFENDVFVLRAYYWGNDERVARLPNFLHKPSGYEIRWYKYPLRDAYSSQKLEIGDFNRILNECLASIGCLPF